MCTEGKCPMTASLSEIRKKVALYKGAKIKYRTSKGRRKVEENQGVIVETYPNIFTLWVESQKSKVSFSYAELLTHEVELELMPLNQKSG